MSNLVEFKNGLNYSVPQLAEYFSIILLVSEKFMHDGVAFTAEHGNIGWFRSPKSIFRVTFVMNVVAPVWNSAQEAFTFRLG